MYDYHAASASGFICYCSKSGSQRGIEIKWENDSVIGYGCDYPDCPQDCQVVSDRPVGFRSQKSHTSSI